MLGNSYPAPGGPMQANLNSMGMMNDVNSNDGSPFDINDFPQLSSRPSSAGGPQGQLGTSLLPFILIIYLGINFYN